MTEGPWWIDLGALAATVTAAGIILRMIILPGLKTIWRAVVSAPQIAAGVGRLIELLEFDLLSKVEQLEKELIAKIDKLEVEIKEIKKKLIDLEQLKK